MILIFRKEGLIILSKLYNNKNDKKIKTNNKSLNNISINTTIRRSVK